MMANMRIAKKSSKPICRRGTMAFMMDFSTICRPGRGRKEHSLAWGGQSPACGMSTPPVARKGQEAERMDTHHTSDICAGTSSPEDAFGQLRIMGWTKWLSSSGEQGGFRGTGFWIWPLLGVLAYPCPTSTWWDVAPAALCHWLPPRHGSSTAPRAGGMGGLVPAAA